MSSSGVSSPRKGKYRAPKSLSRSAKVGLQFPVPRIFGSLKEGKYADRVYTASSVYLTAVLEYLVADVLEVAENEAKGRKKNRIGPKHIETAVQNDEELRQMLWNITISSSNVCPIHQNLLPYSSAEMRKEAHLKNFSGF